MCTGTSFSQNFSTWIDFKTAADEGDAGFGNALPGNAVYCLRVRSAPVLEPERIVDGYRRSPMYEALAGLDAASEQFFHGAGFAPGWGWGHAKFADKRLERIASLPVSKEGALTCPIVYFGCSNKHYRRMHELMWLGHTVNHALWALLHAGWEFDLGFSAAQDQKAEEARLKAKYRAAHSGKLAPLMDR